MVPEISWLHSLIFSIQCCNLSLIWDTSGFFIFMVTPFDQVEQIRATLTPASKTDICACCQATVWNGTGTRPSVSLFLFILPTNTTGILVRIGRRRGPEGLEFSRPEGLEFRIIRYMARCITGTRRSIECDIQ